MAIALLGTHVPLLALVAWFEFATMRELGATLQVLLVALCATLVSTGLTLVVLDHLLRPVRVTAKALRLYREQKICAHLPTHYTDEVGVLMADAHSTLRQLDNTLETLQYLDEVTGLPNRNRFAQNVQEWTGRQSEFAVGIVRVANLNRISESVDSRTAEVAARTLAQRLSASGVFDVCLSKVGPSKFGCLLAPTPLAGGWSATAAAMRHALEKCAAEIQVNNLMLALQLHGGMSIFPADGTQADELIDAAINASSLAPATASVVMHSARVRKEGVDQLRVEQELRRALDCKEFVLHYQPVFDVRAGRVVGAEALLRWNHPERGLLYPAAFIAEAESSGLINPMGRWVLHQACLQLGEWNRKGLPGMRMAVNVSAHQFLDVDLRSQLREAVEAASISAGQLEIELTETVAMVDQAHTRKLFTALRDEGVGIAIDDFGTGYASLSYLRRLPFDKLKIDREFVVDVDRQREGQAICGALIELARGLDLRVLAEGVESRAEVDHLARSGCDLFQGYYFSRPVAQTQFMERVQTMLRQHTTVPASAAIH